MGDNIKMGYKEIYAVNANQIEQVQNNFVDGIEPLPSNIRELV